MRQFASLWLAATFAFVGAPSATGDVTRFKQDRFVISYWYVPMLDRYADQRYKDMADAHFNVIHGAFNPESDKLLEVARKYDMPAIACVRGKPVKDWPSDPYCWGYHISDEPSVADFPNMRARVDGVRQHHPGKLAYINLYPNYANAKQLGTATYDEHVARFVREVNPDVLSMDHYPSFKHDRDGRDGYCSNLEVMRKYSLKAGIPFVKRVPGVAPVELRDDYGFTFWSGFQAREGAGMAVNWTRIALQAGKSHVVPPVVIGIGAGDWRDALTSYQEWARTWCPIHERSARESFKHCFYRIFTQPDCHTALAELDRSTYPDYLQFMVQKVHLNGNYGYREHWGLPEIQRFVRECRKRGIATNHYVEGYIAHSTSGIWKEKGNEWGQMAGGKFQTAWANQCMWLGEPGWHGWLAGETSRLARDLGLDSIYLDEIGFGTGDKSFSGNPHHNPGRLQPDGALTGVRALLRTARKSLDEVDSGISIYTEGPAADCLFPYLDGVEDYGCRQWNSLPKAYRIPVQFLRFVFPDMKFADIPEDTGEAVDRQVRMCLFNGIGTFTRLAATDAASWIERVHVVERDNRDAFNDRNPTPLVRTLAEGVYCNRFSSPAKTVFTVFNANEYRASGQLLDLPEAKPGHHWVDLMHGSELRTDAGRWGTRAVLDLHPGDVAASARFPVLIAVRADGDRMRLTAPKLAAGEKMVLTLVGGDGIVRKQEPMEAKPDGFSLAGVTEKGKYRAVLKLYREGVLQDVLELPGAAPLDTATGTQDSK